MAPSVWKSSRTKSFSVYLVFSRPQGLDTHPLFPLPIHPRVSHPQSSLSPTKKSIIGSLPNLVFFFSSNLLSNSNWLCTKIREAQDRSIPYVSSLAGSPCFLYWQLLHPKRILKHCLSYKKPPTAKSLIGTPSFNHLSPSTHFPPTYSSASHPILSSSFT